MIGMLEEDEPDERRLETACRDCDRTPNRACVPSAGQAFASDPNIYDGLETGEPLTSNPRRVNKFIDDGVDVNEIAFGATPLYWACKNGHLEVARQLLDK